MANETTCQNFMRVLPRVERGTSQFCAGEGCNARLWRRECPRDACCAASSTASSPPWRASWRWARDGDGEEVACVMAGLVPAIHVLICWIGKRRASRDLPIEPLHAYIVPYRLKTGSQGYSLGCESHPPIRDYLLALTWLLTQFYIYENSQPN
jgi:hypothetical protein